MGSPKEEKMRLDQLLFQRGLAESREKAKAIIMAGLVEVDDLKVEKAGHLTSLSSEITIKNVYPPYVSRGGIKLEAALAQFSVNVQEKVILDVGSSTGGFTDCLLQRGAKKVIAVDVGYGQLHWRLRQDPRVTVLEKRNIRYLKPEDIKEMIDGAVIDVSFISLRLVVPAASELLNQEAFIIALVKPQFEAGRGQVGKGGVVRDPAIHEKVLFDLRRFFEGAGWRIEGCMVSPILGPKGNKEFPMYLRRGYPPKEPAPGSPCS
jgi:23S rRNA (cytidine1920-2'-O)/16S rRNA (cytidine1409-2'-O)-methyltransferase